jgi:hypothetical protein
MALTKPKTQSVRSIADYQYLGSKSGDLLNNLLSFTNQKLFRPYEITLNDRVITFLDGYITTTVSNGAGSGTTGPSLLPPMVERQTSFNAGGTLDLNTGATTGTVESGADLTPPPALTSGQYIYVGFEQLANQKIHLAWATTYNNLNTIPWSDDSNKIAIMRLTCQAAGTGWAVLRFYAPGLSDIYYFAGGGGGGGGGGDNSFKARSITGSTLTLARGALKLSSGDILVTGSGTLSTTTRVDISINLASVQGGTATPTNATTYYLYIDRTALGAAITLTDTGELVTRVSAAGEFYLTTVAPSSMDPRRYLYIAWIRSANSGTSWTGTGAFVGTAAAKLHVIDQGKVQDEDTLVNYVKNPDFEIDVVGAAPKYVTQTGQAGSGAVVSSTVGEILYGTRSLKLTGGNTGGNLRVWSFDLEAMSGFDGGGSALLKTTFVARTTAALGTFKAVMYNVTDAVEVALTEVSIAPGDMAYAMYFQPINGKTYTVRIKEATATTGSVIVDAFMMERSEPIMQGGVNKYVGTTTTNSTSLSLSHQLGNEPQMIELSYYDGTNKAPVDASSYVINKTASAIVLNTNDFDFTGGKYLEVVAYYQSLGDNLLTPATQWKSAWQTSTSNTTLAHGLSDLDAIKSYVTLEWDTTTGRRRTVTGLVSEFDGTNFYLDWAGFSPSATLQYQIIAGGSALPQSLPLMLGGYTRFVGFGPGSYPTLTAALVGAAAGDSFLINGSYTISAAETVALSNINITFMPNVKITQTAAAKGLIITGSDVIVQDARYEFTNTGTIPAAIEVSGDDVIVDRFKVVANGAGQVMTTAINILSGGDRARLIGRTVATAGTISTKITTAGSDTYWEIQGA